MGVGGKVGGGGVGQKEPNTSFSPVTSADVKINPKNFLKFTFILFVTLVQNFKAIPTTIHKILETNLVFM